MEMVKRLYGEGLRLFKMKTGFAGHAADLKRMERFRKELPSDAELRIDYKPGHGHPRGDPPAARTSEAFRPTFIEQPVPGHHRAGAGRDHALRSTRRCWADESVFTPTDALLVAANRMADLVSIKIMKHGGMMAGRKVAAICEAAGHRLLRPATCSRPGLPIWRARHMIAATPNISLGCEFYQAKYFLEARPLGQAVPDRERPGDRAAHAPVSASRSTKAA